MEDTKENLQDILKNIDDDNYNNTNISDLYNSTYDFEY